VNDFSDLFYVYRKDRVELARQYVSGLLQTSERKNIEQITRAVPQSDHQALQQFISDSTWDASAVMNRVAVNTNELIGDADDACLIIDESCFSKKGTKSVGVARQWSGNKGKVDNCQVGVFSALCNKDKYGIINAGLYLPQEWVDDKKRCNEAKIPLDNCSFKTKDQIALDFISKADLQGIKYGWVCTDAGYGKGFRFCESLNNSEKRFLVDIHSDLMVYRAKPKLYIPDDTATKGRKHSRYVTDAKSIKVDKLASTIPNDQWKTITIRNSSKGDLDYEYYSERIWVRPDKSSKNVYCWWLVVRRNKNKSDYKYSVSNASARTALSKLAYVQSQRFWIERAFEDYKGHCGMAEYEVRSWQGWHHHMALVMMSGLFVLQEKLKADKKSTFSLTCADIEYLLQHFLPKRIVTDKEIYAELYRRIKFRELLYSQY
jgi:SRSO17 transposase